MPEKSIKLNEKATEKVPTKKNKKKVVAYRVPNKVFNSL